MQLRGLTFSDRENMVSPWLPFLCTYYTRTSRVAVQLPPKHISY